LGVLVFGARAESLRHHLGRQLAESQPFEALDLRPQLGRDIRRAPVTTAEKSHLSPSRIPLRTRRRLRNLMPGAGLEPARPMGTAPFKGAASASFATRARRW